MWICDWRANSRSYIQGRSQSEVGLRERAAATAADCGRQQPSNLSISHNRLTKCVLHSSSLAPPLSPPLSHSLYNFGLCQFHPRMLLLLLVHDKLLDISVSWPLNCFCCIGGGSVNITRSNIVLCGVAAGKGRKSFQFRPTGPARPLARPPNENRLPGDYVLLPGDIPDFT